MFGIIRQKLNCWANVAYDVLRIFTAFSRLTGMLDSIFPYGFSIGGIVALALTKIFPTYVKYERKFFKWGKYGNFTYIKFW